MANSFYNPYSKSPDYAGGLSSMGNNIGMMLLLKKLMGQQGQQGGPSAPMGTPMNAGPQGVPSAGGMNPPGAASMNPAGQAGIDPGVLQKVQQLLGLLKLNGMPGLGGGPNL